MSTFLGKLEEKELDFIAIDCFESHLFNCSIFMLSHLHEDHMRGIYESEFHNTFNNIKNNMVLYASPVTITYIKRNKKINLSLENLKPLEVWNSHLIPVESKSYKFISVTLIPAGHCPGSVMFLIEAGSNRILYTGDFRIQLADFKQFKALLMKGEGNYPKRISSLYLDTTFASKNYYEFPARKESSTNLIKVVEDWLSKDPNNKICLWMPGYIGIEYAIVEVAKHFKNPVHVHKTKYEDLYSSIVELDNYVTPIYNKNNRIHACSKSESDNDSRNCVVVDKYVKCIQLNAMAFTTDTIKTGGNVIVKNNITRVCYSSHASCKELRDIIQFLKPEKLYFNVMVNQTYQEIYDILTENNWAPKAIENKEKNTKTILRLSNKYQYNVSEQKNRTEDMLKKPRLESPERD